MSILAKPKQLLDSLVRSWIIIACNNRRIALAILLLSAVIIATAANLQFITFTTFTVLAAIILALIVSTATALHFLFFIERGVSAPNAETPARSGLPVASGITSLDKLLQSHQEQIASLLETMETLEQENKERQSQYRTLTDNLAAAVIIRDANGKVKYCSPFTEVLTGYALSEIYQASNDFFWSITHEDDREAYNRALKIISAGEAFKFQHRFLHKTGIEMWAETRTVPVLDQNGEVSASLSVTLDVTGAVRYQRQVEEKNRDLQDFTYMVSHDLKAPIFTIKGMTAVLEEDGREAFTPELKETLSHIAKATNRLEQLVSSVLQYSRISTQEMKFESVDLNGVFEDIKNDFAAQIREANAEIYFSGDFPNVTGERVKIYQIFSNLLGNALKYHRKSVPPKVEIRLEANNQTRMARICIVDNGEGIPSDKLDKIFRPFHRLHGSEIEGSGIGLACVKRILEKLGGSIEVKSTLGSGSEFTVTLKKSAV